MDTTFSSRSPAGEKLRGFTRPKAALSRRRLSFEPCARSLVAGHYLPLADNPGIAPESDQTRSLQSDQGTFFLEITWKNPRLSIGMLTSAFEGPSTALAKARRDQPNGQPVALPITSARPWRRLP